MRIQLHIIVNAKCPATFCPLFASQGSPWTGDRDRECERMLCGFFGKAHGEPVYLQTWRMTKRKAK